MVKISILLVFCFILSSVLAFSHRGKIDSQGGHNNRSTGEYHFHSNNRYKSKKKYRPKRRYKPKKRRSLQKDYSLKRKYDKSNFDI
jgi:hypothetical protein